MGSTQTPDGFCKPIGDGIGSLGDAIDGVGVEADVDGINCLLDGGDEEDEDELDE
jgi:hypothetical protein